MTLSAGTKLGQYEIAEAIGAGGMGEVYRARDTKLGREVAIKVLPEELSKDRERLSRFEREAKLLASLNHPGIATLYGLEEDAGKPFLVMELIEGETLAERIGSGAIPTSEALPLFIQIAEGLEAAHEKGIIHRDLKPANIKITPDNKVKVLDFGLAKAFAPQESEVDDSSQSPTLTKGTALGAIMGTASYMSPEQARGKPVDKRTDIWAFGSCLYEALTGKKAFRGETVTDTISAVVRAEPNWTPLSKHPQRVARLLARCLQKDPRERLRDIGDARIELRDALAEPSSESPVLGKSRHTVTLLTALAAALATGLVAWILSGSSKPIPSSVTRFTVSPLDGQQLLVSTSQGFGGHYPPVAISQDGKRLVFVAHADGPSRLYLRELDSLETRPLPGTENAYLPFFSPDGQWVGYLVGDVVRKVSTEGGVPLTIGKVPRSARGAAWLPNGSILIGGNNTGLLRLNAETGVTEVLTQPNNARGEQYHAWPNVLPDGDHVLFTAVTGAGSDLGVFSQETGEWRLLEQTEGAAQPHYLASGHLVFFRPGGLFAASFSLSRMALEDPAEQVMENVIEGWNAGLLLGFFAASASGTLAFVPGSTDLRQNDVMRVDRSGRAERISEPGRYNYLPAISPDGSRLVVTKSVRTSGDLWVLDLERSTRSRLTTENANIRPVWAADGRRVIFSLFGTSGSFDLYSLPADGGVAEPLLERDQGQFPTSASNDGRLVAFNENGPESQDIHILPLDGNAPPYAFLATAANERNACFSPGGRFLAYVSDETGRDEVYVQPIAGEGSKITISPDGGRWPRWSPKGDELFYRRGSTMMVVPVQLEPSFRAESPMPLFDGPYAVFFDVYPDGRHFSMLTTPQAKLTEVGVVVNWSTELEQRVPTN